MKGMTKPEAKAFEDMAARELTAAFGAPAVAYDGGPEWTIPRGNGSISVHLICDSKTPGRVHYRSSWIACKWRAPRSVGPDGYSVHLADMPGGWPGFASYPSGKCNLHPTHGDAAQQRREFIGHFLSLTERGGPRHEVFRKMKMEFEPAFPDD